MTGSQLSEALRLSKGYDLDLQNKGTWWSATLQRRIFKLPIGKALRGAGTNPPNAVRNALGR